jgi:hypothetical protein
MFPCFRNSANGKQSKQKTATSIRLLQMETETANFRLFAAKGNEKRKFVFLGRQVINSNRSLLYPQICAST